MIGLMFFHNYTAPSIHLRDPLLNIWVQKCGITVKNSCSVSNSVLLNTLACIVLFKGRRMFIPRLQKLSPTANLFYFNPAPILIL